MNEEKSKETLIVSNCVFEYQNLNNASLIKGQAKAKINKEELIILERTGQPFIFNIVDMSKITSHNYKVIIKLFPESELLISDLGYNFEDFLKILIKARNSLISKYLLMQEKIIRKDIKAYCEITYPESYSDLGKHDSMQPKDIQFELKKSDAGALISGDCEVIIFETGISIQPNNSDLIRIPYCEIVDIIEIDYGILIKNEDGIKVILNQMGYELDSFKKCLFEAIEKLQLFAQNFVKTLDSDVDTMSLSAIGKMLMDGRAAMKKDILKYSKNTWTGLEKLIEKAGMKEEYNFLKSISVEDKIAIGLKQGLMGDLTGDYLWFLIPVYPINNDKGSAHQKNVMILEAIPLNKEDPKNSQKSANNVKNFNNLKNIDLIKNLPGFGDLINNVKSEKKQDNDRKGDGNSSTGMATYIFKIFDENELKSNKIPVGVETELLITDMIRKINKALISINFRREPIYLSEEALHEPKNISYRFAVANIPVLAELRRRFIGRINHCEFDEWKKNIEEMIKTDNS